MEKYLIKVRHTVPMFLYVAFGTIAFWTLVRWASFQFDLFELKEDVWTIWVPFVLPWIPITIWLRPKFRILIRKKDSDRMQFGFQLIAWFTIGISMIISQEYLNTALGEMANLNTIDEITKYPKAQYFTIKDFVVLRNLGVVTNDIRVSGKHNEHLDINLYFPAPIGKDTSDQPIKLQSWYGVKFHKQISNRDDNDVKEEKYRAFYEECLNKMNHYDYHNVIYFKRTPKSNDRDGFLKAIEENHVVTSAPPIILEPKTDAFDRRNGNKLTWTFGSLSIGLAFLLFCLIFPRYSLVELDRQQKGLKPKKDEVIDMLKYLIPKKPHFASSVILDINILVCLVMILSGVHILYPNVPELLPWGAVRRYEVMHGESWRLVAAMFVHGGLIHLISNVYGLVIASMFLEESIGSKKYLMIYMVSGLMASVASILWYPKTASVGASGAIFGLFGAILSFVLTGQYFAKGMRGLMIILAGPYVALNLLFGLFTPGIGNAAHIGGLITGFVIGLILYMFSDKHEVEV